MDGIRFQRWERWFRGTVALAFAACVAFVVMVPAGFWGIHACGDACGADPGWRGDPNAWQWTAQMVLAALGVLTMLAGAIGVFARAPRRSPAVYGIGFAVCLAWFAWTLPLWGS